ncbi:uncharacterized protein LOC127749606 [Frankliniella occidentalis]|uniref:Uncharacterized protein LOC127749606 n=1 Tax=Frankliniella occidentalis TaxID=133901 RepID=A0A9C6U958_FRAOC|nr:uncharacterized protein LOC127749606 [Frankliniella occidentalis]
MENQQYHVNQLDDPIQEHRRRILVMIRKRRRLRDYSNPFDITVVEFNALYRMPQHIMVELINILEPYVRQRVSRLSVPFYMKVFCSVAFYASGSYQRPVGEGVNHNIAQGTVSKCVKEITNALNHADILTRFIHLPDTIEERNIVIDRNALLGMPKTLGYVDGTLVKIVPPPRPNQHYRCRKGYPAINVLIVRHLSDLLVYCCHLRVLP